MILLFCVSSAVQAQLYTGSVVGLVTDPSGAVVPGAKITLMDEEKGYSFTAQTDSAGRYVLRSIPPGNYSVKAEAQGFQTEKKDDLRVNVEQNLSVDFALSVGSISQTVEVKAATVHLQTEDAVTGRW